jgi:hypothetical protein
MDTHAFEEISASAGAAPRAAFGQLVFELTNLVHLQQPNVPKNINPEFIVTTSVE